MNTANALQPTEWPCDRAWALSICDNACCSCPPATVGICQTFQLLMSSALWKSLLPSMTAGDSWTDARLFILLQGALCAFYCMVHVVFHPTTKRLPTYLRMSDTFYVSWSVCIDYSTGGFIHAGTMWRWMDQVDDHVLRQDLLGEVRVCSGSPALARLVHAALSTEDTDRRSMNSKNQAQSQITATFAFI
jgi:hypothetical protein